MSSSRGFRQNDGDWTCPECNNLNFARRMECNRCGVERKYEVKKVKKGGIEIGKSAAEKSKGLFSADDWMCKTCGNVNWARRSDCNMCNTPKVNVQEERTGYGGGFNERLGVEYKQKEDSDGEYDEFGRKKKKYRGRLLSTEPVKAKSAPPTNDDDEEEEEDDSDEGDASQYDLEADEEDEEGDASKYDLVASDSESSRSRSRSKSSSRSKSRSRSRGRRSRSYSSDDSNDRRRRRSRRKSRSRSRSRSRSPHRRNNSSHSNRRGR